MFVEKGTLPEVPLIRLLLGIFERGLTGILYLKKEEALKVLYFNQGKLIWAISNAEEDKLEDVLVSKGLVEESIVETIKAEEVVTVSIGKILVEKGHITLEQLIEATKLQIKNILLSVLNWEEGEFQFDRETPPERLFSLDLNIMSFIFSYIMNKLDIKVVWKEIRSLRNEFVKTSIDEKIGKYGLKEKENRFLSAFDGGANLEGILKKYPGSDRDSLLKIVYFFIMAELLIKKTGASEDIPVEDQIKESIRLELDEELLPSPVEAMVPEPETPIEPEMPEIPLEPEVSEKPEAPKVPEKPVEPELPEEPEDYSGDTDLVIEDETRFADEPVLGKRDDDIDLDIRPPLGESEEASYVFDGDMPSTSDIIGEIPLPETAPPPPPKSKAKEERKKKRQFNFLVFFVILIFLIGAAIFLLLFVFEKETDPGIVDVTPGTGLVEVKKRRPAAQRTGPPQEESKEGSVEIPMKKETDGRVKTEKKPTRKEALEVDAATTGKRSVQPGTREAAGYFQEGDFIKAGDLWRRRAMEQGTRYAILLELDCLKESVENAYRQITNRHEFYILNRKKGNRNCFLVLWGRFKTQTDAAAALPLIPEYFRQQSPPARVIDLREYF